MAASPQFLKGGARLRRGLCRRVVFASAQGATAATALKVADCRRAAMLIKSALRDWLSVSYGMIGTLVISRCAASPYPAAPDFPPSGEQNKTLYAFL